MNNRDLNNYAQTSEYILFFPDFITSVLTAAGVQSFIHSINPIDHIKSIFGVASIDAHNCFGAYTRVICIAFE